MTTIAEKTESGAKAEHTPTPWSLTGWSIYEIYGGEDCRLGKVATCPNTANRDFILRACNAHDELSSEVEKLRDFKAYVHHRLDAAGVPADPESPHKAEGCRIGGRLDIVLKHYATAQQSLAALKDARAKLSVLAQDNIDYLDCWHRVNEAIDAAEGPPRPSALSAMPTAQPSEAEQAQFDQRNVADPYDGGRL